MYVAMCNSCRLKDVRIVAIRAFLSHYIRAKENELTYINDYDLLGREGGK